MSNNTNNNNTNSPPFRCHYEVLGVERDADAATIKKAHRKLALQLHPDKNVNNNDSDNNNNNTDQLFLAVQQAYECLSDAAERKWYNEHRDALLQGWTVHGDNADVPDLLFDLVPYMQAGCYQGYDDDTDNTDNNKKSFYAVYNHVFQELLQREHSGEGSIDYLSAVTMGHSKSSWDDVTAFYQAWESFRSTLSFAWADVWDLQEAEHRQVRRGMEEENKKARRQARKTFQDDVLALVHFVQRRDPRVQARRRHMAQEKLEQQQQQHKLAAQRKLEQKQAVEQWRQQAEQQMAAAEEEDRQAGRVRLADLEDDYDYGGGKKKGKKGKKSKKQNKLQQQQQECADTGDNLSEQPNDDSADGGDADNNDDQEVPSTTDADNNSVNDERIMQSKQEELPPTEYGDEESSSEEEEIDTWRCECCRKDFKSAGQMENHLNSKKHKIAWQKYESKIAQQLEHEEALEEVMDGLDKMNHSN